MTELLEITGISIFLYMTFVYGVSIFLKDASIVDVAWGLGFIMISLLNVYIMGVHTPLVLVSIIVTIWGARLAWHILKRKISRPGEDFRYAAWRKSWGKMFLLRSYFQVFLLQGLIMFIISLPIIAIANNPRESWSLWMVLGSIVWAGGFACESIADSQLSHFKSNPQNKGKVMTTGLWKLSRHPNYFGESVQWWGVWVISLSFPYWWAIVSPLLLTYLLLYVSGVPMLEKKYAGNPEFEKYKANTSAFIPWFPRSY